MNRIDTPRRMNPPTRLRLKKSVKVFDHTFVNGHFTYRDHHGHRVQHQWYQQAQQPLIVYVQQQRNQLRWTMKKMQKQEEPEVLPEM